MYAFCFKCVHWNTFDILNQIFFFKIIHWNIYILIYQLLLCKKYSILNHLNQNTLILFILPICMHSHFLLSHIPTTIAFWCGIFYLWALFGSFSTVIIRRHKHKESWILTGRSACPVCHHTLSWHELLPIFSFLLQKGKCRHCQVRIAASYFWIELLMGSIFCAMAYIGISWGFFIYDLPFWILVIFGFITGIYVAYDILYQEIPDVIMVFWFVLLFILFIFQFFFPEKIIIPDKIFFSHSPDYFSNHIIAAWILYSFLFLQILIPWTLFLWRHQRKKEILELISMYILFPITVMIDVLFKTRGPESSEGDDIPIWVWAGDLLIALFIGLTLGVIHGIVSFFLAYIFGSIIAIIILFFHSSWKSLQGQTIAFWPFLALWWLTTLLFYIPINHYIQNTFFMI